MPDRDLASLLEAAERSDYFSAPGVVADVEAFLAGPLAATIAAGRGLRASSRLVLVGSGGSLACLITAQYVLDAMLALPVSVVAAKELRWRDPAWLDATCTVLLNSWSGRNSDVLDALAVAKSRGARVIALVANPQSPLALAADEVILYTGRSIYEIPVMAAIGLAIGHGVDDEARWRRSIDDLPTVLGRTSAEAREHAREAAEAWVDSTHMYVLGAGPSSSLGLKLANVLMENVRVGASYYDTSEFRHGAVEALERTALDVISLVGTDPSRELSLQVTGFCARNGARVVVFDADGSGVDPLLSPLVTNSATQWFVVHSALLRAIDDLDERIYMGTATLSDGTWP